MLLSESIPRVPSGLIVVTGAVLAALFPPLLVSFWRRRGKVVDTRTIIAIVAAVAYLASIGFELWYDIDLVYDPEKGAWDAERFRWYVPWRLQWTWPTLMNVAVVALCISAGFTTLWCWCQRK
jgi:hypothetical protein